MMKVADIMIKEVVTIRGSATVAEAVCLMKTKAISALIVDRRHPQDAYGIITKTDIIKKVAAYGKNPKMIRVYEIMTKPCIVVNPDLGVEYAARLFTNTGIHCAPVIKDELLGIICASDILSKSDFVERPQEQVFDEKIEQAVAEARRICAEKDHTSSECKAAWDMVEELQAEAAHQRARKPEKTALEAYLEEYPEAQGSLMLDLDNWCSG
jgi:CBS domain-containing protein